MHVNCSPSSEDRVTAPALSELYLQHVPHAVYILDERHRYLFCNEAYCALRGGGSPEALLGQKALGARRDTLALSRNRSDISREETWKTPQGPVDVFATRFSFTLDDGRRVVAGMIRRKLSSIQEATLMHRVISHTQCLLWEALVYEMPAAQDTPDELLLDRTRRTILNWNLKVIAPEAVRRWLPFPEGDIALEFYQTRPAEERARANETSLTAFREGKERYSQEFSLILDDRLYWLYEDVSLTKVRDGLWHLVGICTDVTERKRIETNLAFQALHDPLTGLPNRRQFLESMAQLPLNPDERPGLLFIDVDNFKLINDSQGHRFGDAVLIEAARRIRASMRGAGLLARLGGDEFTVLVAHVPDTQILIDLAERLNEAVKAPVLVQGITLHLSLSVGIAHASSGNVSHLLRNADTAMHRAKGAGKSGWALFEPKMDSEIQERFERESALRHALSLEEISLSFQPIYSLRTGGVVALEGLARWDEPTSKYHLPSHFISLAEETGLIVPLGTQLLRQACVCGVAWRREFPELPLSMNVNVSERQFRETDFVEMVQSVLDETGMPPHALTLELTESILMDDPQACVKKLHRLDALGTRLVLDDFGTGYSSLAYLTQLPVRALKIDRRFILALRDPDPVSVAQNEAVVRMILALAGTLGLEVTAEGIEDADLQRRCVALGADYGQGYHFGRPMPNDAISPFLQSSLQNSRLRLAA